MDMMVIGKQYEALINAPFGAVAISLRSNQLAIDLLTESPSADHQQSNHPLVKQACAQIKAYFQQASTRLDFPLSTQGTAFQQAVWQSIAAIPIGQTATYGQLAKQLDSGPRAVANACGANTIPLLIPCHRVVAQKGIGGFMQGKYNGVFIKQWLLAHEGVVAYAQGERRE